MLKMVERFHSNHNFSCITEAIFIYFDFNFFLLASFFPPSSYLSPLLIHLHFYPRGRECGNFFINESKILNVTFHFSAQFFFCCEVFCEKCEIYLPTLRLSLSKYFLFYLIVNIKICFLSRL